MIRTLELSGSPQEIGRRHGQTLGKEIRQVRRILLAYLARITFYAAALPLYGLLTLLARRFRSHIPPRLIQEMAAVAAGASLGAASILLINVLDDLANNLPRCSALAADPTRTGQDSYLMGRNLDYPLFTEYLLGHQTLFFLEPEGGLPLASLAWPGYAGVCTGINGAGVSLAQLTAVSRTRTVRGVPAALRFRLALEQGSTVTAAADLVMRLPATIGNNLLLCSASEALVVELAPGRQEVRRPEKGLLSVTNHFQGEGMLTEKGRFPKPPPYSVLAAQHFTEAYSQARNRRLQELAGEGMLDPPALKNILADSQIANPGTVVCAIFRPADRTVWLATGSTPPITQGPLQEIRLWG